MQHAPDEAVDMINAQSGRSNNGAYSTVWAGSNIARENSIRLCDLSRAAQNGEGRPGDFQHIGDTYSVKPRAPALEAAKAPALTRETKLPENRKRQDQDEQGQPGKPNPRSS
jgi:hypothetical protein